MPDHFKIEGPANISFSGGRTSGYMLWRCFEAWGRKIPDDVEVFFANTGEEMPATLDFVRDVTRVWGIPITWVEYRLQGFRCPNGHGELNPLIIETEHVGPHRACATCGFMRGHVGAGAASWTEVSYETASRQGEPFDLYLEHVAHMCATKEPPEPPYLPGPGNRFCTTELKIRPMKRAMLAFGYEHWTNIVGIRFDEPKRWRKINRNPPERWDVALPLVDAQIDVAEVRGFWRGQPFDLGLAGDWEGNCDACHLKMPWKVARVFQDHPERAARWLRREKRYGKLFRPRGPSIEQLVRLSKRLIAVESDEYEIKCTGCTD